MIRRLIAAGFSRKFGFTAAALALLLAVMFAGSGAQAQSGSQRRPRRESTANRKARIARTIAETYGHKWEAGGGGGYMRYRAGKYLQQDNEVSFWASTMYALNPKWGVLGTVQGSYGKAKLAYPLPSGNTLTYNPRISEYAFMAGPNYRLVKKEKLGMSAFAQAGLDLGKFAGDSKGLTAADIGVWSGDYAPVFSAGLNLDYNIDPALALRLTPAYVGTTFGSTMQNSKSVNVGIIYRFGKTK